MALGRTGYDMGTFQPCPNCNGTRYRQQYDGERWCWECGHREEHEQKARKPKTRWIGDPTPAYKKGGRAAAGKQRRHADPEELARARAILKAMTGGQ